jgi:hypothetical protein
METRYPRTTEVLNSYKEYLLETITTRYPAFRSCVSDRSPELHFRLLQRHLEEITRASTAQARGALFSELVEFTMLTPKYPPGTLDLCPSTLLSQVLDILRIYNPVKEKAFHILCHVLLPQPFSEGLRVLAKFNDLPGIQQFHGSLDRLENIWKQLFKLDTTTLKSIELCNIAADVTQAIRHFRDARKKSTMAPFHDFLLLPVVERLTAAMSGSQVTGTKVLTLLAIDPLLSHGVVGPERPLSTPLSLLPPLSMIYDTDRQIDMTVTAAYRDILLASLEFFNLLGREDFVASVAAAPDAAASLFNVVIETPAGRDGFALVLLALTKDDFLRPIMQRFFYCCTTTKSGLATFRDYSVVLLLSILDEPPLPSTGQLLALDKMPETIENTLETVGALYGASPVGLRARLFWERLQNRAAASPVSSDPSSMAVFLSAATASIYHPRSFITFCGTLDRLLKTLKPDCAYIHFAIEFAAHIAGVVTPECALNSIVHVRNITLTSLAKIVPFDGLLAVLLFNSDPFNFFGAIALFLKHFELPTHHQNRHWCLRTVQRDSTFLPGIVLRLARSEVLAVTHLLIRFVRLLTMDGSESGLAITASLAAVIREQTDARTFLRLSTAFVRADGFMKWLRSNQGITGTWAERATQFVTQEAAVRETIAYVLFWCVLGTHSIQMPRVAKFAQISLSCNANRALVLDGVRSLYRTSTHYTSTIPWEPEWGNQKSGPAGGVIEWPMDACLNEITGKVHCVE